MPSIGAVKLYNTVRKGEAGVLAFMLECHDQITNYNAIKVWKLAQGQEEVIDVLLKYSVRERMHDYRAQYELGMRIGTNAWLPDVEKVLARYERVQVPFRNVFHALEACVKPKVDVAIGRRIIKLGGQTIVEAAAGNYIDQQMTRLPGNFAMLYEWFEMVREEGGQVIPAVARITGHIRHPDLQGLWMEYLQGLMRLHPAPEVVKQLPHDMRVGFSLGLSYVEKQ